ncbi:hypothetical protein E9531_11190 [Lampropedia puyangensis]|uniref:Lipoprotein n=1 Tax=Lampropedia puyangensis TaxID=1330072 RepID=A0A4S8EYA8_9BURK|nr:hypothetical protein [Lampropedia puyangensis]THT99892.1 hypothetical protein E9531_11190 [Lampropedia puyangensis]
MKTYVMHWMCSLFGTASLFALAGCQSLPEAERPQALTTDAQQAQVNSSPQTQPVVPPQVLNLTPYPNLTLAGIDQFGEYTSLAMKITYLFDDEGQLTPTTAQQEGFIDESTPVQDDNRCMAHGGGYNQRTVFFPDTGVFVLGGTLHNVIAASGQQRNMRNLTNSDEGVMGYTGAAARVLEYVYVPCVGATRVAQGVRLNGFVNVGDRLVLKVPGENRPIVLHWPADPLPFVRLSYAQRANHALVPARVVVLSVDVPQRRVVAQYQATLPMVPVVQNAVWFSTLSWQRETLINAGIQHKVEQVTAYLNGCKPPQKPMDPCANPYGIAPPTLPAIVPEQQ